MKKFVKIMAVVLSLLMVIFAFASCGSKEDPENTTEPVSAKTETKTDDMTYVVASDNGFAPFEYLDTESGKYVGIDMDILAAVAEDQGFKYTVNNIGFDAAMSAVQAGQADAVIAGASITEERQKTYDFTDGYFDAGQVIVVAADSTANTLEDLRGQKVSAKAATQGYNYCMSVKDEYDLDVTVYEDSATMYQSVVQGQAVACFEDEPVVRYSIKANNLPLKVIGETLNPSPYGVGVKKGENAEFVKMFNEGLKNIKANGKYEQILAKYGS